MLDRFSSILICDTLIYEIATAEPKIRRTLIERLAVIADKVYTTNHVGPLVRREETHHLPTLEIVYPTTEAFRGTLRKGDIALFHRNDRYITERKHFMEKERVDRFRGAYLQVARQWSPQFKDLMSHPKEELLKYVEFIRSGENILALYNYVYSNLPQSERIKGLCEDFLMYRLLQSILIIQLEIVRSGTPLESEKATREFGNLLLDLDYVILAQFAEAIATGDTLMQIATRMMYDHVEIIQPPWEGRSHQAPEARTAHG